MSAWESPAKVRKSKPTSVTLPSELASRAAFFARLHRPDPKPIRGLPLPFFLFFLWHEDPEQKVNNDSRTKKETNQAKEQPPGPRWKRCNLPQPAADPANPLIFLRFCQLVEPILFSHSIPHGCPCSDAGRDSDPTRATSQ